MLTKMDTISTQFLLCLFALFFIKAFCKYETDLIDGSRCARKCKADDPPMTCSFKFDVESYYTMSKACYDCPYNITDCFRPDCIPVDGVARIVTVVNRKLPGPSIQVCLGDAIIVDVNNLMVEESTSVHWHGHHQKFTPYMDGVPFLTQCPIAAGTTFQYRLNATHIGTHFWHSHTGTQRADGAFGSMIVRQPRSNEIHASLYDYDLFEHVIQVADWIHESSLSKFHSHYHGVGNNKADTILVNGMGKYKEFKRDDGSVLHTPLAKFNVQQGKRYRFRVINAGFLYCPVEISVDNHSMIVISSDGSDIQPIHVESLIIYAGERWDFILNANNNVSNYWIKFRGLMDCGEKYEKAYTVGVVHYRGAPNGLPPSVVTYEDTHRDGKQLNPVNKGSGEQDSVTAAELNHITKWANDPALKETPDISLTLSFDFYPIDNFMYHKPGAYGFYQVPPKLQRYTPQINHISLKMPSFPPLSEPEYITSNTFCNESLVQDCDKLFCGCVYTIDIPLNKVVEIMLIDEGLIFESNHPFHLHGHSFRVISLGKLGNHTTVEEVKRVDEEGRIERNLRDPPLKDTVTVPDGGYTVIRFYTTNPGYWLFHCHLDFHVEVGMAVIFHVGDEKDVPPVPKHFPKCGNFYNQGREETTTRGDEDVTIHVLPDNGNAQDIYVYDTTNSTVQNDKSVLKLVWSNIRQLFTTSSSQSNYQVHKNFILFAFISFLWNQFYS